MKVAIEGRVISAEKTMKGKDIIHILADAHPETGAQDVYKVFVNKPLAVGAEFKGVLRATVDLWFLDA